MSEPFNVRERAVEMSAPDMPTLHVSRLHVSSFLRDNKELLSKSRRDFDGQGEPLNRFNHHLAEFRQKITWAWQVTI